MLQAKWWRIVAVTGWGLLAGAAVGRASGERPPTYVWLFSATGEEAESLTESATEEFEEALVKAGCLPIVQRRNLPDLESHQAQEKRIQGADSLSPRQRRLLSTASADAVVFGKLTDDIQGGQVKIAVTLETLSGVTLANTSVRISRGKRLDAEERERQMAELATDVCSALGFTGREARSNGVGGSGPGRAIAKQEIDDIEITLTGLRLADDTLIVEFQAVNTAPADKSMGLFGAGSFGNGNSTLITDGIEYNATSISVGGETWDGIVQKTFISGVPLSGRLVFKGIPRTLKSIPVLKLAYSYNNLRPAGVFTFRDLQVD
jgi:hypothetical protein